MSTEETKQCSYCAGDKDAVRFCGQFTTGYGDYTKERKELFKDLTIEDVEAAIEAAREDHPSH